MATVLDATKTLPSRSGSAAQAHPKPVVVNGVRIPRVRIAREVQNHPASKPAEAWLAAARALVVRELLLQEAHRLGIVPEPVLDDQDRRETAEEALVRGLIEREVVTPAADEATCRRYFEQNRAKFRSADLFAVRHILCPAPPDDAEGLASARHRAETLIKEISDDPSRFPALAAAHSACPSGSVGGSLGQISRGQTVPEFEKALEAMTPGRLAPEPVQTRYGFHVVFADRRIDGEPLPFDAVRSRIAEWLADCSRLTAIRQYIAMLWGRAEVSGIDLEAMASPSMP